MSTDTSPFSIEFNSMISFNAARHCHNTGEIVLASRGCSVSICEGKAVNLIAPYLIFYPAGAMHEQYNLKSTAYQRYCFTIDRSYIGFNAAPFPCEYLAFELLPSELDRLNEYARLLFRYFGGEDNRAKITSDEDKRLNQELLSDDLTENYQNSLDELRKKQLLTLFLYELEPIIARHSTIQRGSGRLSYIGEVCRYISEKFAQRLTIDQIALEFYISRSKLTSDFRSVMRMSLVEYLTLVRCSKVKTLLISTNESLAEIAEACGFCSASHLIAAFKRINGMSPNEYRKNAALQ